MKASSSFWRDTNRVPILGHGLVVTNTLTFTGSNTTVATPIFDVTGTVELLKLWGIVTVVLGASHTAAHWRINDHTSTAVVITKATGTDLSSAPVGSLILANVLAATALTLKSSAAGAMLQPAVVNSQIWSPSVLTQKTGGIVTHIEYVYSTTDTPTSGSIQFFAGYLPLSEDGKLAAS